MYGFSHCYFSAVPGGAIIGKKRFNTSDRTGPNKGAAFPLAPILKSTLQPVSAIATEYIFDGPIDR
jgi:hypothetical protein